MRNCYLLFILFILGSWKNEVKFRNTWFIYIGKNEVANYSNSRKGLTVFIDSTQLKDTIFIEQYLCGQWGRSGNTIIILKNEKDSNLLECTTISNGSGFKSGMPINTILNFINSNHKKLKLFQKITLDDSKNKTENLSDFFCYVSIKK